ncbi:MAG: SUMF1/EgtB/PvdO family nonheme iron enzyme, partial [Bacteroidetes bacterium]|nr:SUMF1/EgtB/PvdO family nonheme iron enzyme [Bacteroidota bacterium]
FRRGRGDYAGIAGKLNDGAMITSYVYEYPPNDFGLYNIGGNVSEWVQDVYRPLSFQDMEDLNPIRRDGFLDQAADKDNAAEGGYDNIFMHPQSFNSLITDDIRVYKGASWNDMAYWVSPGTRRFLEQDSSTATIGFRCAMIRAGSNY